MADQNPETPDEVTAAVTGSSRRAQEPAEASVLAALEVLGWPDDRLVSAHPDLTEAGHYWSYVSAVLAAAAAADAVDEARDRLHVAFKLVPSSTRAHTECRLYAGPDRDHLALCGELRLRHHEYMARQDALTPPAQPTNGTERAEAALQRFAGELWRLASGLADRGIPLRDGPVEGAAVDTALSAIDRRNATIADLDVPAERLAAIRSYPQDRSGDGVPEVDQARPGPDNPDSPAAKMRSLRAQPHGSACICDDCTARDEAAQDQQAADCNGDQA